MPSVCRGPGVTARGAVAGSSGCDHWRAECGETRPADEAAEFVAKPRTRRHPGRLPAPARPAGRPWRPRVTPPCRSKSRPTAVCWWSFSAKAGGRIESGLPIVHVAAGACHAVPALFEEGVGAVPMSQVVVLPGLAGGCGTGGDSLYGADVECKIADMAQRWGTMVIPSSRKVATGWAAPCCVRMGRKRTATRLSRAACGEPWSAGGHRFVLLRASGCRWLGFSRERAASTMPMWE